MKSRSMARFTPATTATPVADFWCTMAACRQLPPGRSTNTTAGAAPMASLRRFASRPVSQPSLLTATSWSPSPVICRTASTRPEASAACDTTTPFSGSLIILGEILAELLLLFHTADQALVQLLGRVDPAPAKQVVQGDHLGNDGDVLAGVE